MTNLEIADTLESVADLLEIQGANPFRTRAYRNAVRTIEGLTRSLSAMVAAGEDVTVLPGVGKEMGRHIHEMVETGALSLLDELCQTTPLSLVRLTRLPGVGPKKAAALFEALGVETPEALEAEIRAGRVELVPGFGKKSCEKILRGIGEQREIRSRFLRVEAERLVAPLQEWVAEAPGVERVEVAGSLRRKRETIGDVDLLAQAAEGGIVVERFVAFPGAASVEASGPTKGSIVLRSGLQVDLRVIPAESWGAALHYFTGSKEHNVAVRQRAQRLGRKVSEWGVFEVGEDGAEGARIAGATEAEVFGALGLPWIAPELRENRGELEAALEGRLPSLLTLEAMKGDLQMHSTWSDGKYTIRQMADAARERGYEYIAITDHSPALSMVQGLTPARAREQWEEIERVRDEVDGIHVLRSLEVDILKDGTLDMDDDVLEGLDLVLVSIHSFMDMERDAQTERVLRALAHPAVDVWAHPTGRLLNRRKPVDLDMERVLGACVEHDVAVEINASPNRLDLSDVHALRARQLGLKLTISTDAHTIRELDNMRHGVDQARRAWLEPADVLNTRSLDDFMAWVRRPRA
ncbi:MAG: DNA polymerase/3'-5' exonuclease PolX [Gemmatimonadetes bacterium]|nr:DNA polymerase/3'-5' exonuclease PolX [Gemmatimonadota bacterium]